MSYEGYVEHICKNGHYHTEDCWGDWNPKCPFCGELPGYRHSVDVTNGYDEDFDYSCDAPKVEKGFSDIWHTDHYGNRYATKLLEWEPAPGSAWIKVSELT